MVRHSVLRVLIEKGIYRTPTKQVFRLFRSVRVGFWKVDLGPASLSFFQEMSTPVVTRRTKNGRPVSITSVSVRLPRSFPKPAIVSGLVAVPQKKFTGTSPPNHDVFDQNSAMWVVPEDEISSCFATSIHLLSRSESTKTLTFISFFSISLVTAFPGKFTICCLMARGSTVIPTRGSW